MEVVQPVPLPDTISFSTTKSGSTADNFFNSFMASTVRHAILNATLESFYQYYILKTGYCRNKTELHGVLGCCTLWDGYQRTPLEERGVNFIMEETHLRKGWYPHLRSRGLEDHRCDYVVHDPGSRQVYFYSRIVDSGHCQRFYHVTRDVILVLVAVGAIFLYFVYHKRKTSARPSLDYNDSSMSFFPQTGECFDQSINGIGLSIIFWTRPVELLARLF